MKQKIGNPKVKDTVMTQSSKEVFFPSQAKLPKGQVTDKI